MWKSTLLIAFFLAAGQAKDCVPRSFGLHKVVCVCNSTYCDDTPVNDPKTPSDGTFYWYLSTKEGVRLNLTKAKFNSETPHTLLLHDTLNVDSSKTYQKIVGFGGAFTDSASINIKTLSAATQDQLISTYFNQTTGSRYALGRVPIGSADFSIRGYTYDDVTDDVTLENFKLAMEDYTFKIPLMQKAQKLNPDLKLFGATWSPPVWMKTNDKLNGLGFLKDEYYQLYADYLLKFLDSYKKNGLDFWAISTGNEPNNAFVVGNPLNSMGWTPSTVANWVANNLGPSLAKSAHSKTLILSHDDQRNELPAAVDLMLSNELAKNYTAGVAVHWYMDNIAPASLLTDTHNHFPDKFILMSEACTGAIPELLKVSLGSWERGQRYMLSIIEYLNNWSVGWVDWNIALDKQGGPNWMNNFVDSPIIVNPETDEFFKQPMYYAIKHFSRFMDKDSVRISISETLDIKATAVLTPSKEVVVVLYNRCVLPRTVTLKDKSKTGTITVTVPPQSMNTIIYAQ